MEDPYLAAGSVPAEISGFYEAELEAFVAMVRISRPESWARVERLQWLCRELSPTTVAGATRGRHDLTEVGR